LPNGVPASATTASSSEPPSSEGAWSVVQNIDSSSGWLGTGILKAAVVALLGIAACVVATGVIVVIALGMKNAPHRPPRR
jgi:hypothetical protein